MKIKTNKIKGYTLIEIMLVSGILAITSIGAYSIFNQAAARSKTNDEAINIALLKKDIIEFYATNSDFNGIENSVLNTNFVTKPSMRDPDDVDVILNSFGGNITVSAKDYGTISNLGFTIQTDNVIAKSCAELSVALANEVDAMTINGTDVKAYGDAGIDIASVTAGCAESSNFSTIQFHYFPTGKIVGTTALTAPDVSVPTGNKVAVIDKTLICGYSELKSNGQPITSSEALSNTAYYTGDTAVPKTVRDTIIFEYKNAPANQGRCIDATTYGTWITQVAADKATQPSLTYDDVWRTITGLSFQSSLAALTASTQTTSFNTACSTIVTAKYNSTYTGRYIPYSGNKCAIVPT